MTRIEHQQLVFIASRIGLERQDCCGCSDQELVKLICQRCRQGYLSWVFFVHDHGQCVIEDQEGRTYLCLVELYRRKIAQEGGYEYEWSNSLARHERDYAAYILAQRTNDLSVCNLCFSGLLARTCELCRQGHRAWLDDVHEDGNCLGGCQDVFSDDQGELEKKCWASRAHFWQIDGYRLSRPWEYV